MRRRAVLVAALGVCGAMAVVVAQRASPHETTRASIGGASISIDYGRPYAKGRPIFGGLVPYGRVWRTGADEATTLTTDRNVTIGSLSVPAGKYTLFTLPTEQKAVLIVNKQTGQWGTVYDEKQDLGRVDLARRALDAPVEQLTIVLEAAAGGGVLKITWERTEFSVPFKVS